MKDTTRRSLAERFPGVGLMLLSAFCFSLMSVFVKLSGDLPTAQKAFFRNLIAALVAFAAIQKSGRKFCVARGSWPALIGRAVFGTIGLLASYYALDHLVLSDASILSKTSPFFTLLAAAVLLREKIKPYHAAVLAVVFGGCMLVIKPQFGSDLAPSLIGLLSGAVSGVAYALLRWLKVHGENSADIVFFFSAFSCVMLLPLIALDHAPMSVAQTSCLLAAGSLAALAQFALTGAYSRAPAKDLVVFEYSQVLFAALWGLLFFGQLPDALSWLGYAIVIGAAVWMGIRQKKDAPDSDCRDL